jgi:hypothetical protein
VKNIIHGKSWLTVREVAEEVGISTASGHTILTEHLGMHWVSEQFVPGILAEISSKEQIMTKIFWNMSRHGFMLLMLKPNNSPHTWWVLLRFTPRKHYSVLKSGLENFWQNIQFLPFHNPPIHLSSPLLAFFLYPKLIITHKERQFHTVEYIITNVTKNILRRVLLKVERWWEKFVSVEGDYFKGDNIR